jgi:TolB-like protein
LLYRFADCVLDTDRRELHRGRQPVAIAPQVFDLLEYLIKNRHRVVSKDDLIDAIWEGRIISETALSTRINVVRSAIDDTGERQRFIRTLRRKGVRFVGIVHESQEPDTAVAAGATEQSRPRLPLPDSPSIAVLPFTNIGGDPEQEYFADGMVEEIITALSRFSGLMVIARNSSFAYKGRCVDVKQVGRELGVRYVLEGSVRKAANRLRITGQLIDASNGAHIWADRFEGVLADIFDLQDEVTASVVGAMSPKIEQAEIERAKRKPTGSLDAYDYFLHGIATDYEWSREANKEAARLFIKAVKIDPAFASAYGMAAYCYCPRKGNRWMVHRTEEAVEASRLARKAVSLGKDDAVALSRGGQTLAYVAHDLDAGRAFIDRALALNPNLAFAWFAVGYIKIYLGQPEAALQHLAHTIRLSPFDSMMPVIQNAIAFAHFLAGDYDKTSAVAEQVLREKPDNFLALRHAAASNALAGRVKEALQAMARLRQIDPELRVCDLKDLVPLRRPEDRARLEEGMRKAGLPE